MPAKQRAGSKPKAKVASSSTRGERQDDGPVESERSNTEAGGGQQRVKKKGVSWTPVFKRIGFFLLLFLIPGLLNYAVLNQEARMLIPEGTNLRGGEARGGDFHIKYCRRYSVRHWMEPEDVPEVYWTRTTYW